MFRSCSFGAWRLSQLPVFDGAGVPRSERQPFVVGVVMFVMSSWSRVSRNMCFRSTHLIGNERASRCSVDSRRSCIRVLVVAVVATNFSGCVASLHRLVHLLVHDFRLARLHPSSVTRCFNSRCLACHIRATSFANLFASSETCTRSPNKSG